MTGVIAGDERPDSRDVREEEAVVGGFGRHKRVAMRSFKGSDRFWKGLDKARENPPAPRLRGQRLRDAVAGTFDDADFADRAEESARELAVNTLVALAKSYKHQKHHERESASSLEFAPYEDREDDPLDTLLDAYDDEGNPAFGPALVAALAQVGAAAILQLGKEVDQPPKAVVRALLTKYFTPSGEAE